MEKKYAFLVIDSIPVISIGLKDILKKNFDYTLFFNETRYSDIIRILSQIKIDLVFLEIIHNSNVELSIISEIRKIKPNIKILVFTDSKDKVLLRQIKRNLGVCVLQKTATLNEIVSKVSKILIVKKEATKKRINAFHLSEREHQITNMLLNGMKLTDISKTLQLSNTTVATYKCRVFKKCNVKNILELEKIYIK